MPCSTHTIGQLADEVRTLFLDRALRPRTILCINAHIYNLAVSDPQLRRDLRAARVVLADGMSIVWGARLFAVKVPHRCNATEAFRAFLAAPGMPPTQVVLAGMSAEEAAAAAVAVNRASSHCRVTHTYSGFLSDAEYQSVFARHVTADAILLGLSTPRTERVAALATAACPNAVVWGIGAGTIKILAGSMSEAPVIWRRLGIQWLHRLAHEPRALWRRYLLGNPLFVARVLAARWRAAARGA